MKKVAGHRKAKKVSYPIYFDARGRLWKELGLRGYPMAFLVGRDGKVVWEGMLSGKKTRGHVRGLIDRMTGRKPKPR